MIIINKCTIQQILQADRGHFTWHTADADRALLSTVLEVDGGLQACDLEAGRSGQPVTHTI
jgi:hypothetical protein